MKNTKKRMSKKTATVAPVHYLRVLRDSRSWGGDRMSDERYSSREDSHTSYDYTGVEAVKKGDYWDFVVTELADVYFILIADYDTGDSFGRDCGKQEMVFLSASRADTEAVKAALVADEAAGGKHSAKFEDRFKPVKVSLPSGTVVEIGVSTWRGYFETFHGFRVMPLMRLS